MASVIATSLSDYEYYGQWNKVTNRYLGLKFQVKGKKHYGWARLSVTVNKLTITPTLTGYAYETVPSKPVIAGKTKGTDVIEAVEPASLGHLAQGSAGLAAWLGAQESSNAHRTPLPLQQAVSGDKSP